MGKLGKGCDVLFIINGDKDNAVWMGTKLSSEQLTYQSIAKILKNRTDTKTQLKEILGTQEKVRSISKEEIESNGIIPNSNVYTLSRKYTGLDWDKLDKSVKLLMTDRFEYYGKELKNCIIQQGDTKMIVINPGDDKQVLKLYNYLYVLDKLKNKDEETEQIFKESNLQKILEQLPSIKNKLDEYTKKYNELKPKYDTHVALLEAKQPGILSKSEIDNYIKMKLFIEKHEDFNNFIPETETELIQDYIENKTKYTGLNFIVDGSAKNISYELDDVTDLLEGKQVKDAKYQDAFANLVARKSKFIRSENLRKLYVTDLIQILNIKLEDINSKMKELNKGTDKYIELKNISKKISDFLNLKIKSNEKWKELFDFLVSVSDDEFSYRITKINNNNFYFKDIPMTISERYTDVSYPFIKLLKPEDSYKGFNIYSDPNGFYYYDRHILTTESYGKKYKSIYEIQQLIDRKIANNTISEQTLIEFKTKGDRTTVYVPNKFRQGQVVRSLNIKLKASTPLNETEQKLIYNSGSKNSNTLKAFYNYFTNCLDSSLWNDLYETIDTSEKAACFVYMVNEREGISRNKLKTEVVQEIFEEINNAEYKYFMVESSGSGMIGKQGFKKYYKTIYDQNSPNKERLIEKEIYKTVLIPIQSNELSNNTVQYNEQFNRPQPMIRVLDIIANKIKSKLDLEIHIKSQSELDELFKEWGHTMPDDVKAFVKNGEIYINASNATQQDSLHELTHILLGVLKAKNYDNYVNLVNTIANHKNLQNLKISMKKRYKYLAQQDLNEEIFAEVFGRYLVNKDLDLLLSGELKLVKEDLDNKMQSLFGSEKINDEFYTWDLQNIYNQFGYDVGQYLKEGNGLELEIGNKYRRASTWIEEQIKNYRDSKDSDIKVQEFNC